MCRAPPVLPRLFSLQSPYRRDEHTLEEQWQVRNQEHQEDTDDAPVDPLEYRDQIVASRLSNEGTR